MRLKLDHLAVVARDLETGARWMAERLGVAPGPGGRHARFGTWNRLMGLGSGLYLEVIAPDPEAASDGPRWFGLDAAPDAPRLGNWICAVDDISQAGDDFGTVRELSRGDLRWRIAVPKDGSLPAAGGLPTLIEWGQGVVPPGESLPEVGVHLSELVIRHPDAAALEARIAPLLTAPCPVRWEAAPAPALAARFETPGGTAWVE